jgi:aldehyde dehydrogenase (NAD+)
MGPVINLTALERILDVVDRAGSEGAGELLAGGKRLGGPLSDGYFVAPTVFGSVDNASSLAQDEIFGPVLSLIRFGSDEEAVALANGTRYGLGAFVFTRDLSRAHRVADRLEAGWIGVNGFPPMPANAPFGGVKRSGFGREGGAAGLEEFLRPKNVFVRL